MAKRNPIARALRSGHLRPRLVPNKRRVLRDKIAHREITMIK